MPGTFSEYIPLFIEMAILLPILIAITFFSVRRFTKIVEPKDRIKIITNMAIGFVIVFPIFYFLVLK